MIGSSLNTLILHSYLDIRCLIVVSSRSYDLDHDRDRDPDRDRDRDGDLDHDNMTDHDR